MGKRGDLTKALEKARIKIVGLEQANATKQTQLDACLRRLKAIEQLSNYPLNTATSTTITELSKDDHDQMKLA